MNHHYNDITSRIAESPKWYDENAVPRYCDFSPREVADIYCDEVALVEISCQACGTHFLVAFSSDYSHYAYRQYDRFFKYGLSKEEIDAKMKALDRHPLAKSIQNKSIHYGDPPNTGCCPAGATMNCEDLRVCEYWRRSESIFDWERLKEFEIDLDSIYEGE
jgi:hypothetical protein